MFLSFKNGFFLLVLSLIVTTNVYGADSKRFEVIQEVMNSEKIQLAETLLAPFESGEDSIDVIVMIEPSTKANELAEKSAMSTNEAKTMFKDKSAPTFYDLTNQSVKDDLKETVKESIGAIVESLDQTNINVGRKFKFLFGFSASVTLDGLRQLANTPEVLSIEEDRTLYPHLSQGIPLMNGTSPRNTYDGSGLSIAICDTGIDTSHTMLGGGGSPIFNSKVIGGYDTGKDDNDPRPSGHAHGTACAGIAAGDAGTVGDYIGGVAPGAKLYAIKISNDTDHIASSSAMIAGWEWAIDHQNDDPDNPIMIISTSFGSGRYYSACDSASSGMTTAAANAVAAGITIFASSGNDGYCESMGWPACISYVNSVGAVYDGNLGDRYPCVKSGSCATKYSTTGCSTGYYSIDSTAADMVTSYSNSASFLTMFAPSNDAYTTDIVGAGGYSGGDYATSFGGTSAACPYAAGAAAVLQSAAKSINGSYLTPSEVQDYLTLTGDSVTDSKVAVTKNRVNLDSAVNALTDGLPSTFPWPTFLPAIMGVRPYWGVTNSICHDYCTQVFALRSEGFYKLSASLYHIKYQSQYCSTSDWDGWQQVNAGPKSFFWEMEGHPHILTYEPCINQSGSFTYTLERDKKYLFYPSWTGTNLEIRVTIYNARAAMEAPEGARLFAKPVPIADELVTIVPDYKEDSSSGDDNFQCILP